MLHEHITYKLISHHFPYKYKKAARHSEHRSGSRDALIYDGLALDIRRVQRCNVSSKTSRMLKKLLTEEKVNFVVLEKIFEVISLSSY